MKRALSIAKRELTGAFNSPIPYIVILFFVAFCAIWLFFVQGFFAANRASLRPFFAIMPAVFTVLVPAMTMRTWAEERRMGTFELLATLPYTEFELALGKFLASYATLALAVGLTLPIPLLASLSGDFDLGQICTEYLGVLLMGGACTAIGGFVSALSRNQVSAFIASSLALISLSLANLVVAWVGMPSWLAAPFNWISVNRHFDSFVKGVLDSRDLAYFLILGTAAFYATVKALSLRKWR